MKITTRKATAADLPAIYNLVKELAIYENEPDAVTATFEDYQRDFSDGIFQAIVGEHEGTVIGMTLFYLTYSTWKGRMMYLEDFVIQEAYRRHGVGQILFDAFIEESKKQGTKLVKWQVLDWNEPALNFYRKNGAIIEKEWWNGKMFLTEI